MRRFSALSSVVWISLSLGWTTPAESSGDSNLYSVESSAADFRASYGSESQPYYRCDSVGDQQRVIGLLPSDHCFDGFISPISNPFFFEDPRSLTEFRGVFLNNTLPGELGDGDIQVLAAQLRGRLTERWSVIAPRLGHIEKRPDDGGPPHGFLSAPIGLKYNLVRDVDRQMLISGGATYFIPGSAEAISNFGDGDIHFFLTSGAEIFEGAHWLSGTGFRIPVDSNWGTQFWYWSNQWDYELPGHIHPLVGVNWYHWMKDAGNNFTGGVTSIDLIDLPTAGVAGNDVVTGAVGIKWTPSRHLEFGGGFEIPMTDRSDILESRAYADVILRY